MSRVSKRRRGRYLEARRKQEERSRRWVLQAQAIGADVYRRPEIHMNKWGLGEGDIWHLVESYLATRTYNGMSWQTPEIRTPCGQEGYVVADTIYYKENYPPEFDCCETCKRYWLAKELGR